MCALRITVQILFRQHYINRLDQLLDCLGVALRVGVKVSLLQVDILDTKPDDFPFTQKSIYHEHHEFVKLNVMLQHPVTEHCHLLTGKRLVFFAALPFLSRYPRQDWQAITLSFFSLPNNPDNARL